MIFVCPALFLGYKIVMRTHFRKAATMDLYQNLDEIEEYQRNFVPTKPTQVLALHSESRVGKPADMIVSATETPLSGSWTGFLVRLGATLQTNIYPRQTSRMQLASIATIAMRFNVPNIPVKRLAQIF
jgi:hypothetical protein